MLSLERRDGPAHLLDQGVPFSAVGTLPRPAVRNRSAGLTDIAFLRFRHADALARKEREGNKLFHSWETDWHPHHYVMPNLFRHPPFHEPQGR
ncbi:hypothetical protein MGWOODY_Smn1535 [hydrothermal vent metagenome]|uniref:Uncharacterized protein n=1 Tax=hydrothermal vent metagenome TaxID=652676 RepID=A0A160TJM4_9ZZZZ